MPLLYLFITGNYSHKLKLSKWYTSFFKQYFIIICVIDTKKGISIKNILNVSLTQLWKCLPAFLFLWTTPFIVCGRTQDLNYHGTNPCKKMSSIMTALFFFPYQSSSIYSSKPIHTIGILPKYCTTFISLIKHPPP